jgi:hypothetical protein
MRRGHAAAAALVTSGLVCGGALAAPAGAATASGRWVVSNERAVPIEWFQGLTHSPDGASRFFVGVFQGVTRTDAALRPRLRNDAAIPPEVQAQYGFNHIGDPTYDRAGGGRLLLPLECYVPGGPNGGNTCGRGGIGILDPMTLRWRGLVLLDGRDIAKAMWAEVSPDGRLLWTSSGADLLAYSTADLSAAHEAPAAPIRPVGRLAGAVPPGGVAGGAFHGRRLLLSEPGAGRLRVWSVDVEGGGARRVEATLPVDAEAEGLDVLPTGDGLLHWLLSPVAPGGREPTYGSGHSEIVSLVPRLQARLRVRAQRRGRAVRARVTLRLAGRARPVAGARVRVAGVRGVTDARGAVRLRVGARASRRMLVVTARKAQLRAGRATLPAPARRPALAG